MCKVKGQAFDWADKTFGDAAWKARCALEHRNTGSDGSLCGKVGRMNLENVQRISVASESACIAVLQKSVDAGARKRLFLTLSDLIDPAFQGEEADNYNLDQLIREARPWADIVRTHIQLARAAPR